ncbi:biopolymer transporter ExbD [Aquabacterium sp. OR-4]|uniref:biopolymer transporter ExbD n=1 Tax=Aquabacterium sp. OR-4 TaxID=2978127 RepID=UPI0028C82B07|nr:biopolymer transporter ExbD [Aquabacterium sp. OR-4]MDT7836094.1 biopolymer transporter ExbD [Aquabacterium sp. OR-4]
MAAVAPRGGRARRRAMAEMNMVPFIDVMLVLLIIFMVSAPLITTGLVDLPSVGKAKTQPPHVVEVVVGSDEKLRLRLDGGEPQPVAISRLAAEVKKLQAGDAQVPVVISADKNVKYDAVVRAMDTLQRNGIARVGLAVRQGG